MIRIYDDAFPVTYGQFYLLPDNSYGEDLEDSFRGQSNGICGTALEDSAFLVTGLHTGDVQLTVDLQEAAPEDDQYWHDIVEAPIKVGENGLWLVSWNNEIELDLRLLPGTYRIRYCAINMGDAEEHELENAALIEKYRVSIWPAVIAKDVILKKVS